MSRRIARPARHDRLWDVLRATLIENDGLVESAPPVSIRNIFRRFWPYTKPFRFWLFFALVLVAIGPLLDTVAIWLFKVLVDRVLTPANFSFFPTIAAAYIGVTLAIGLVGFADRYLSTWTGERFVMDLRTRLFTHLQTMSPDFFDRRRLGDTLTRLTGDVQAIESLVLSGVASTLSNVFKIVLFTGVLFYLSWKLAIVALIALPVFLMTARWFSRRIRRASREKRRRSGSISAVAEENLANNALVQAYGQEKSQIERFQRENRGSFIAEMAATRLQATFLPLVDLIEVAGVLLIVGFGIWELTQHNITLGGLLAFVAYISQLYSPVRGLGQLSNAVFAASAGAERIIEVLDERPKVASPARPRALERPLRGIVEFTGVTFHYPRREVAALHELSFRVTPGQVLALVGVSGAGKSTIGKLLLRFYDPDRGRISLDGHDLRDLDLATVRGCVGTVMQETLIFDDTIRNNILWGAPNASDAEVRAAAQAADAADFILGLPDGYDTRVGQRGRALSGGQRQRVALARAIIRNAPILLLDEPTTGLDADSTDNILIPLRAAMADRTSIVISHDLLTVHDADQILYLEAGRITEAGTHPELIARNGGYAALYDRQRRQPGGTPASPPDPVDRPGRRIRPVRPVNGSEVGHEPRSAQHPVRQPADP